MNIISLLRMGDRNAYYHIEGLLNSSMVNKLIIVRENIIPFLIDKRVKQIPFQRPSQKLYLLIKIYLIMLNEIRLNEVNYIISFYAFPYGFIAKLVSLKTKIPCHIGFVGSDVNNFVSKTCLKPVVNLLKKASVVTVTDSDMMQKLISNSFDENKIKILPNSVPVDLIKINIPEKSDFDLLFIGRLIDIKDVKTIVKAAGVVSRSLNYQFKLCIVGDGPDMNCLKQLAAEQPKNCLINFMGYQDDPYKFFSRSKIFILASKMEGIPFALIEAMCAGLVPIVTSIPSLSRIIKNGENGFLFNIGDYQKAAEQIALVMTDRDKYCMMREKALGIRKIYSLESAAKVWDEIFINYQ